MRKLLSLFLSASSGLMATSLVYVGSFHQGDATITGFNFAPSGVMVFASQHTASGSLASGNIGIGFCKPSGTSYNATTSFKDTGGSTANTVAFRALTNAACLTLYSEAAQTKLAEMTLGACTSASCALTWGTNDATNRIYNFVAFGGTSITVATGSFMEAVSPVAVTTGCIPNMIFTLGATQSLTTPSTNMDLYFGVQAISPSQPFALGFGGATALGTSAIGWALIASAQAYMLSSGASMFANGSVTSTTGTSGGQFVWSEGSVVNSGLVQYMALCGDTNWQASAINQPASPGTSSLSPSFTPGFALVFSANNVSSSSTVNAGSARFSIGATDGVNKFSYFFGAKHAATIQVGTTTMSQTTLLNEQTEGGASPTTNSTISGAVFGASQGDLTWSVTDATARQVVGVLWDGVRGASGSTPVRHRVISQ